MKIEEIKYKIGMDENEHSLACKLNEIIKLLNEKEEEIEVYTSAIENYKKPLSHFFKPEEEQAYYWTDLLDVIEDEFLDTLTDNRRLLIGNCYRTREEAQLALDKQMALVRLWDWDDKNTERILDWESVIPAEKKCYVVYDCENEELALDYAYEFKKQNTLPYFKSEEDCEKFIKEMRKDLELILK